MIGTIQLELAGQGMSRLLYTTLLPASGFAGINHSFCYRPLVVELKSSLVVRAD